MRDHGGLPIVAYAAGAGCAVHAQAVACTAAADITAGACAIGHAAGAGRAAAGKLILYATGAAPPGGGQAAAVAGGLGASKYSAGAAATASDVAQDRAAAVAAGRIRAGTAGAGLTAADHLHRIPDIADRAGGDVHIGETAPITSLGSGLTFGHSLSFVLSKSRIRIQIWYSDPILF